MTRLGGLAGRLSLPTAARDWRRIAWAVRHVLGSPRWLGLAIVATLGSLALFVAFDRPVYVRTVVFGGSLSPFDRIRALAGLLPTVTHATDVLRAVLVYLTAGVVGTNVALLGYQLAHDRVSVQEGSGSVVGVVLGTLGAGCASCGLAVVASALSLTGVAAGLTALPLDGVEFLLIAFGVAVLSLHWVAVGLAGADVEGCPVDV